MHKHTKMELILCSSPCILIPVIILSLTFLFHQKNKLKSNINLPPGPPSIPFLGNLHHIAISSRPHQTLRDLAKSLGPVMLFRAGDVKLLVISSRDAAKEVMKVQDAKFAERPTLTAIKTIMYGSTDIAFSKGEYWRRLRKVCVTELLSSNRVKSFSSIRQSEVHRMLKTCFKFSNQSKAVNLCELVSELSNSVVLRAAFGGKCKRQREFIRVMKEAIDTFAWFCPSDIFASLGWLDVITKIKLARIHRELDSILEEILQEHLKNPKEQKNHGEEDDEYDFVDILIREKQYGDLEVPITWDNIKAVIMDVFTGGTDTASNIIAWAMSELIKNPDKMAKAQAEVRHQATLPNNNTLDENALSKLNYLKLVIKETLRLHPPVVLLLPRVCKQTCHILGYTIPSNTIVVTNAWALGRDETYWRDGAEEFRPERFENCAADFRGNDFEFVPFGAGRRGCPGVGFGSAVVEVTLAKLLLHFDWKLPGEKRAEDLDMVEEFGATIARKNPLFVVPVLRVPVPDG